MKKILVLLFVSSIAIAAAAQTKFTIDPMHSFVNFSVRHSGISFVDGSFKEFNGSMSRNTADFQGSNIAFTVKVSSIGTNVEMRDNHLKSADFFDAAKYPEMTFVSTSFKKQGVKMRNQDTNQYNLRGKLTIKGITKTVVFTVFYGGTAKDQQGNTKIGFTASTNINRLDYNINYDPTGAGIAKDVKIVMNLQFTQVK